MTLEELKQARSLLEECNTNVRKLRQNWAGEDPMDDALLALFQRLNQILSLVLGHDLPR